ncbi:MAG: chemotaxis protein CheW [Nitrospirota bacterium]|nr:chemotaxis protein CheW [Nitrospirota bacterium]
MPQDDAQQRQGSEQGDDKQFVVFQVAGEEYGVDALRVLEITGVSAITRVPYAPSFVRGVSHLRGTIMPVMDLRLRLGFPEMEYGRYTSMIVLQNDEGIFGFIADTVDDMLSLPEASIMAPQDMGMKAGAGLIRGMVMLEGRMIMLLDVDRLFVAEEIGGRS